MDQGRSTWLTPADAQWNGALAGLAHDVYHTPEYVAVAARHEGGEPQAFLWQRDGRSFLVPLVIKALPPPLDAPHAWSDAFSPYGYASPVVPADATVMEVAEFFRAFSAAACERNLITAFVRLHPLMWLPQAALRSAGTLVHHGTTIYMDLREPEPLIWDNMRHDISRNIRKLIRNGYYATFDRWEDYGSAIAVYRDTMQRVGAAASYHFSDHYFAELRAALGERLHLCSLRSPDGDIAAVGLFFVTGDYVQYHLSGTSSFYLPLSPAKLVMHSIRMWAAAHGYRYFHVGGGVGGAIDSLHYFKAGFSPLQADFLTLRLVFNAERYHWLNQRAGHHNPDPSAWFPAYRRIIDTLPTAVAV